MLFSGSLPTPRFFVSAAAIVCLTPLGFAATTDAVIDYAPGIISSAGLQQNGNAAVGLPAAIDDGNTSPFTPPFHASAITIIGAGGHITLHFSTPVIPVTGPDIGIFTNTGFVATTVTGSITSTTTGLGLPGVFSTDAAVISVSADNLVWFPLDSGKIFDLTMPSNAFLDSTLTTGGGIHAIGGTIPSDPFLPLTVSLSQFAGLTYPQMVTRFDGSFGGAWVDTSSSGLDQIKYIRFDVPAGSRLVLDAVTAVPEPGTLALLATAVGTLALRRTKRRSFSHSLASFFRRTPFMKFVLMAFGILGAAAAPASALTFTVGTNTYDVESIKTSGTITDPATANHALLALDFDPAHVYLFGYEWQSGSKSGTDLFVDVAGNSANPGTLAYDSTLFGAALFIGGIDYAGLATTDNYDPLHYSSWQYYISDNGEPLFAPDAFGASDRALLNGSIDDWTLLTIAPTPPLFESTRMPTPLTTVPEPASLAILVPGAAFMLRHKR